MRRLIVALLAVFTLVALVSYAEAGLITKVLFSERPGSTGLQVTQSGSDPKLFFLTFAPQAIDSAIVGGVPVPGDPSIGWDTLFGMFIVDRTTRVLDPGGNFASYTVVAAPGAGTLNVLQGLTNRLAGDVVLGKLYVKVGGMFGGMDGALKNVTVNPDASAAFTDFANYSSLAWGFSFSGLDLDSHLLTAPAGSGYAATAGYIAVPEPATLGLLGLGVAAMVIRRRKK